jgi:hypothetical protein
VEEAAIGLSGRVSLNGLLPSPGPVKRIAGGDDEWGARSVAGVTLRGEGMAVAPLIGATAVGECAGWEFAGAGAFRVTSPVESFGSGLASGFLESGNDGVVIAEDGPIGATLAAGSSGGALRDWVAGVSECDSAVPGAGGFTPGMMEVSAAGGVAVREVFSRS